MQVIRPVHPKEGPLTFGKIINPFLDTVDYKYSWKLNQNCSCQGADEMIHQSYDGGSPVVRWGLLRRGGQTEVLLLYANLRALLPHLLNIYFIVILPLFCITLVGAFHTIRLFMTALSRTLWEYKIHISLFFDKDLEFSRQQKEQKQILHTFRVMAISWSEAHNSKCLSNSSEKETNFAELLA